MRRTEDDLRAAFAAKAAEAPDGREVLAAVKAARLPARRRWLAPVGTAAAAMVAAAIAVPIALNAGGGSPSVKAGSADKAEGVAGAAGKNGVAAPSVAALCHPDQVGLTLRWRGSTGVLTATNRSSAGCQLPSRLTLLAASQRPPSSAPPVTLGELAAHHTATAPVTWTGCPADAGLPLRADWGAGPVPVTQQGRPPACAPPSGTAQLQVGSFTGLS